MRRSANAVWHGNLKQGNGIVSTESGAINNVNYSFAKRFGETPGTNPEELIGAAHASCFAIAFSAELENKKLVPENIEVSANVNLENVSGNWTVNKINLKVTADVPGAEEKLVREAAETAKANCPISRLLKAEISMDLNVSSQRSVEAGLQ